MARELLVALGITLLLIVITRNPVLSVNISLLISVPTFAWVLKEPWLAIVFPLVLALLLVLHYIPTAVKALAKAGSKGNLFAQLLRLDKDKKAKIKK
jgi:hypothetical protein